MKIIGLKGQSGAGKDTVGDYLIKQHNFKKISFAMPLKQITAIITGWPLEMILGGTPESRDFRETKIHPEFGMTCREILQEIGTDLFRQYFDPETWIKIAKRQIQDFTNQGYNVVITDVRFENEAEMIKSLGGEVWNLKRDLNLSKVLISETASQHISEHKFETPGELTIKNNGTLEDLYCQIDSLITSPS